MSKALIYCRAFCNDCKYVCNRNTLSLPPRSVLPLGIAKHIAEGIAERNCRGCKDIYCTNTVQSTYHNIVTYTVSRYIHHGPLSSSCFSALPCWIVSRNREHFSRGFPHKEQILLYYGLDGLSLRLPPSKLISNCQRDSHSPPFDFDLLFDGDTCACK